VDMVQQEVCRHYGVSLDELVGEKREKRVVVPRQVAMYLARELTQSSLPTLGRAFGDRDHTTVMYAVNKVGRQMADEGEVFAAVQTLTTRLKSQVGPGAAGRRPCRGPRGVPVDGMWSQDGAPVPSARPARRLCTRTPAIPGRRTPRPGANPRSEQALLR